MSGDSEEAGNWMDSEDADNFNHIQVQLEKEYAFLDTK